jgi:outer membrane protein insertion porin family
MSISLGKDATLHGSYSKYNRSLGLRVGSNNFFFNYATPNPEGSYNMESYGARLCQNFGVNPELTVGPHVSVSKKKILIAQEKNNVQQSTSAPVNGGAGVLLNDTFYTDGEASLPIRVEAAGGAQVVAVPGYSLTYTPAPGITARLVQDYGQVRNKGPGGGHYFLRNVVDFEARRKIIPGVTGVVHLQAGYMTGRQKGTGEYVSMVDGFKKGPELVRGFIPTGLGPRDNKSVESHDAIGGTKFWGASLEAEKQLHILPEQWELGPMTASAYLYTGALWAYRGETSWAVTGETLTRTDSSAPRASVGLGFTWATPWFPINCDLAYAFKKQPEDIPWLVNLFVSNKLLYYYL